MDKETIVKGALTALVLTAAITAGIWNKPGDTKDLPADAEIAAEPGQQTTDLLTGEVPPGKVVVTSVNLPDGLTYVDGSIALTKDAIGCFTIHDVKQYGTEVRVLAEEICKEPVRFSADIVYGKPK